MNLFKRLLFNKTPHRLPALRPGQAAIWNENGAWKQDTGSGPENFTVASLSSPHVTNDIEVDTLGSGIIIKSPDGTRWRLTVSNAGAPIFTSL